MNGDNATTIITLLNGVARGTGTEITITKTVTIIIGDKAKNAMTRTVARIVNKKTGHHRKTGATAEGVLRLK